MPIIASVSAPAMVFAAHNRARRAYSIWGGFTLFEMLAVLVLLAIAAMAIVSSTTHGLTQARDMKTCRDIAAMLRTTRIHAMSTGAASALTVDMGARTVVDVMGVSHDFPGDVSISMLGASQLTTAQRSSVVFSPDGSSSGGHLILSHRSDTGTAVGICRIDINWLTGAAEMRAAGGGN